eukprot:scaffold24050_cov24-Tisochrysis_lutea.AAC.1
MEYALLTPVAAVMVRAGAREATPFDENTTTQSFSPIGCTAAPTNKALSMLSVAAVVRARRAQLSSHHTALDDTAACFYSLASCTW